MKAFSDRESTTQLMPANESPDFVFRYSLELTGEDDAKAQQLNLSRRRP